MKPMQADQPLATALRRFWLLCLAAAAIAAMATALVGPGDSTSYSASGTFLVPSAPGGDDPTANTFDAERLAGTYTIVLAQDQQLLAALAEKVGVSAGYLEGRVRVVDLSSSSALRVDYKGRTAGEVLLFFRSLDVLTTQLPPPTVNLQPGTLRALELPSEVDEQGGSSWVFPTLAGLAGLLLGLGAAVLLTRANPRLDSLRQLQSVAQLPVIELPDGPRAARAQAVVVRLARLVPDARKVAVVGMGSHGLADVDKIVLDLSHASAALSQQPRGAGGTSTPASWTYVISGAAEYDRTAQQADAIVLVVRLHSSLFQLEDALESMEQLGAHPDLVLLLPSRRHLGGLGKRTRGAVPAPHEAQSSRPRPPLPTRASSVSPADHHPLDPGSAGDPHGSAAPDGDLADDVLGPRTEHRSAGAEHSDARLSGSHRADPLTDPLPTSSHGHGVATAHEAP